MAKPLTPHKEKRITFHKICQLVESLEYSKERVLAPTSMEPEMRQVEGNVFQYVATSSPVYV